MDTLIGIAIDRYEDRTITQLDNCKRSVNAILGSLAARYVFDTPELLQEQAQTTKGFIFRRLNECLLNSLPGDNIIIVFSGHGVYNERTEQAYWQTSDCDNNDISTWLNLSELLAFCKASEASHIVLILDNCYAGGIFEAQRGGGLLALESKLSRQALTSGGLEPVKDGMPGDLSPFADTLVRVLDENERDEITFTSVAEETIRRFPDKRMQTPMYGPLLNTGDKGGTLILRLKKEIAQRFEDMHLSLAISPEIKVDSAITVPFITPNEGYDHRFLNSFIQQAGYAIIDEARRHFKEFEIALSTQQKDSGYFLEVGYSIQLFDERFLSLTIGRYDHFGGAHPNNYIYTLNFAFHPERRIGIAELVDFDGFDFQDFLENQIDKFADEEAKEHLPRYAKYLNSDNCPFTINQDHLCIYFTAFMPRGIMNLSFLEIPLSALKLKI